MPYNSQITRTDTAALIPEDVSDQIISEVSDTSWLFRLARQLPRMSRKQKRMPVSNALASAYFVDGDTGLKQTTEFDWTNKYIDAEELAAIVPIPESVLDDNDYDIWGEVRPSIVEAMNVAIAQAVLYGTNIPSTWTTNLGAAGLVTLSSDNSTTAALDTFTDLYEALLGESSSGSADGVLMLLEAQGYIPNGHVADASMRGRLRNTRNSNGDPIPFASFPQSSASDGSAGELDGAPAYFPTDGSLDSSESLLISGDWNKLVYAVRQDMTYKILDQAVIQDSAGNIVYNLAQQDMVALRAVMRVGFALPNPVGRMHSGSGRCPFAVLTAT